MEIYILYENKVCKITEDNICTCSNCIAHGEVEISLYNISNNEYVNYVKLNDLLKGIEDGYILAFDDKYCEIINYNESKNRSVLKLAQMINNAFIKEINDNYRIINKGEQKCGLNYILE